MYTLQISSMSSVVMNEKKLSFFFQEKIGVPRDDYPGKLE